MIYKGIDDINELAEPDKKLEKSDVTILFGENSKLDSLGLVNLIVITEQKIEDELGLYLTLADEKAISRSKSPFINVSSFADYIIGIIDKSLEKNE